MWLCPLQGTTQLARRRRNPGCSQDRAKQLLSWSSTPLRRCNPSESTPPRFATPGTFRPQGFSPSRRVTPRSNARSCFIPVTSMGFSSPFRGFPSLLGPVARHLRNYPLGVHPQPLHILHRNESCFLTTAPSVTGSRKNHNRVLLHLQGVAPVANPFSESGS
jgi:hypothetical protein